MHKVFYFIPNLVQGGAERQILELIRRLPSRFAPVLVLYEDRVHYKQLLMPGQPQHVLGVPKMTPAAFGRLVDILRTERPAIMHCYLDRANLWGRLAALRADVPVIISSCRAKSMALPYLLVERSLAVRCQQVVVNSVGIEDELTQVARVPRERLRVIHNFIDLELFRPPSVVQRRKAREKWGLSEQAMVLLMPGRLSLQKHQLGLLLTLERLVEAGRCPPETVLLMPGRGQGTIERLVRRVSQRQGLKMMVRQIGPQTEMRSLYWAADVLVLPSLWEGLPNAALEGAACGLPLVLSRAANLDQIAIHGDTGWEVPTADRDALGRCLTHVLTLPRSDLQSMGVRGRAHVAARFDPQRVLAEMVATYDELLECRL